MCRSEAFAQKNLDTTGYYRNPSFHESTIVFEHNGQIWRQRLKETASKITARGVEESDPEISPDGKSVAFLRKSADGHDVFVVSLETGETRRLTFTGGFDKNIRGWLSVSEILFSDTSFSQKRGPLLHRVNTSTYQQRTLPLMETTEGCVLDEEFFYVKNQELVDSTRLYRGGYAQKIFKINSSRVLKKLPVRSSRENPSSRLLKDFDGPSRNILCVKNRIYFLTDRDGRFNIWSMNKDGVDLLQHTFNQKFDINSMSATETGSIVFQRAGEIFKLRTSNNEISKIQINIPSSKSTLQKNVVFRIEDANEFAISDEGDIALVIIRGTLWHIDRGKGVLTCLVCASVKRAKSPQVSSDGSVLLYLHDESGEYDVYLKRIGKPEYQIPHTIKNPLLDLALSPNGKFAIVRTVIGDSYLIHIDGGTTYRVPKKSQSQIKDVAWSPDSKFVSFVRTTEQGIGQAMLFDIECKNTSSVTSGRSNVSSPVFSVDENEYLYVSKSNFRSSTDDTWAAGNFWPSYGNTQLIMASRTNNWSKRISAGKIDKNSEGFTNSDECRSIDPIEVLPRNQLLGLRELPFVAGNYEKIWTDGNVIYAFSKKSERDSFGNIVSFSRDPLGGRSSPRSVFKDLVYDFGISPIGKHIIARTDAGLVILQLSSFSEGGQVILLDNSLKLETTIDVAKENGQIFREVWRYYRDYFWDPEMRGNDWNQQYEKYLPIAKKATNKTELNEVIGGMLSELGAGHTSITAPHAKSTPSRGPSRLGASFKEQEAGLLITEIYDGDLELIDERSPFSKSDPPLNIGDLVTHVNKIPVNSIFKLDMGLLGLAGQNLPITVRKPNGRTVQSIVVPIEVGHESWLRTKAWAQKNAKNVDTLSEYRVGYIHLESSYETDFSDFIRQYLFLHRREAIILDLRGNNGGNIDAWLLHFLQRKTWLNISDRFDHHDYRHPFQSFDGEYVVLIDGDTYSDGEMIAEGIRRLNLGTLVGSRTSGAGKWVNDDKTLIDGSRVRIPEAGSYVPDSNEKIWVIEGAGVEPDFMIENDSFSFFNGVDKQLDLGVEIALQLVREQ